MTQLWSVLAKMETDRADRGYYHMTVKAALAQTPSAARDREVIRLDFPNDKLGIAASLRRAFAAASQDECTRDFEKLISELN
jgi:hypothetical protein